MRLLQNYGMEQYDPGHCDRERGYRAAFVFDSIDKRILNKEELLFSYL